MSLDALFGARTADIVPDVITPALATEIRARVRFERYTLVDRGSYEHAAITEPALLAKLAGLVENRTQRTLAITDARVLRFAPGDYLLAHADRVYDGNPLELVLDISASATPGAEVHYRRRGSVFFRVPSQPCAMAIVERGPTVTCNHTYVSRLHATDVVRLIALLRDR